MVRRGAGARVGQDLLGDPVLGRRQRGPQRPQPDEQRGGRPHRCAGSTDGRDVMRSTLRRQRRAGLHPCGMSVLGVSLAVEQRAPSAPRPPGPRRRTTPAAGVAARRSCSASAAAPHPGRAVAVACCQRRVPLLGDGTVGCVVRSPRSRSRRAARSTSRRRRAEASRVSRSEDSVSTNRSNARLAPRRTSSGRVVRVAVVASRVPLNHAVGAVARARPRGPAPVPAPPPAGRGCCCPSCGSGAPGWSAGSRTSASRSR